MPAKVKKSILNLKESVSHKHEDSKADYSIGECCGDRLKETYEKVVCYIGILFVFTLGQYELG